MRTRAAAVKAEVAAAPPGPIPKEHTLLKHEAETRIWQPLGRAAAAMSEVHAALGAALEQREALDADPDSVKLPKPAAVDKVRRELEAIVAGGL